MSVPARETLRAHGIEAIADTVVPAIRKPHGHGLRPMESAVWGHLRSARGQGGAGTENFRDDGKEIDTFTC